MKKILEFTYQAKKPTNEIINQIQQIIIGRMEPLQNIHHEKGKFSIHAKAV